MAGERFFQELVMTDVLSLPKPAWATVKMALSGAPSEALALAQAHKIARIFTASLKALLCPPDPVEVMPWLGEGVAGGGSMTSLATLKSIADEAQAAARAYFDALDYVHKSFTILDFPVTASIALEARLSDLFVFSAEAAKGQGLLADFFVQTLLEERALVYVARQELDLGGTVLIAWDAKAASSRAARLIKPLLYAAKKIIIIGVASDDTPVNPELLVDYYHGHGLVAQTEVLNKDKDIAQTLIKACEAHGAAYLVTGAYSHSRLSEFAFGGTTRSLLLQADINLFMAH
jgi:nucleotide-binding universal stress UspA family protein